MSDKVMYKHSGGILTHAPRKNILQYRAVLRFTYPNDYVCFKEILEYYKDFPEDEKIIADGRPLKRPLPSLLRWVWNRLIKDEVLVACDEEDLEQDRGCFKFAELDDATVDAWE